MDNIFQIGGTVSGSSFIGRRSLIETYRKDYIEGSSRVGRSIVGLTRIGKTSFADVVFTEPVHIDSKSTQKCMNMRNDTHSFSINRLDFVVFRESARRLKP